MFYLIKELLPNDRGYHNNHQLTYITCLNALVIVENELINENCLEKSQQLDSVKIAHKLLNLGEIDWSAIEDLQYGKGIASTKILATDIKNIFVGGCN